MNKLLIMGLAALSLLGVAACSPQVSSSRVASANLSRAAGEFEIHRRIVFYNGITADYILTIEGQCAFTFRSAVMLEITCRTADDQYVKHSLGLSDNVTYFSEQLEGTDVSTYHYRVIFRPDTIIPAIELDTQIGGGT